MADPGLETPGPEIELSQADREKWDSRYLGGAYESRTHPSVLLAHWADRLEGTGAAPKAIDIACGSGRNALFLARLGWHVDAIDISAVALERLQAAADAEGLPVRCVERDLEPALRAMDGLEDQQFNLALVIRYTNFQLVQAIPRALAAGGYLIAEMHLQSDELVAGPRNPRFRVAPGELRSACAVLELLHYHEGLVTDPDGRRVALAQVVGRLRGKA